MLSGKLLKLHYLIGLALVPMAAAGQADAAASACSSPETVLQRYIDAVGGKAVYDVQSRIMTAKETNLGFGTEHYIYKFKWKSPNMVTAGNSPYVMGVLPISYPNGTFKFDGEGWSDFLGKKRQNDPSVSDRQRELTAKYPYNEGPYFLELRVIADPLILTRAKELYSGFEAESDSPDSAGLCILRANQVRLWRNRRQDILSFDAASGLLKTWEVHTGFPPNNARVQFQFDDYRPLDAIKFPFYVYFDLYDATFRYTKVVQNQPVSDSEFEGKSVAP